MGRNTGRGNVACNWISLDPAKAGPTLGGVVVVCCRNMGNTIAHTFDHLEPYVPSVRM